MIEKHPLLQTQGLCKYFPITARGFFRRTVGYVKAVDDVSLEVMPGQTLGLVGESGSGKTTLARTILRALKPSKGKVWFHTGDRKVDLAQLSTRELKPLRQCFQMIFQDPFSSLNPRMTVGEIVGEPLRIHRVARGAELRDRVCEMLERVGLKPEHINRYPHAFSGGQRQRIGIARALIMRPTLIIADEAVSALDVSVQAQVVNLLEDLQEEFHLTYIFVAHDLSVVRYLCDRIAVMYAGRIIELGPTEELFTNPLHPYTQALLASVPSPDPDIPMQVVMSGEVADPAHLPGGCSFHPRCIQCRESCRYERPKLHPVKPGHFVACHLHHTT